ncbi:hypothetical protein PLICRDRAFT_105153 [Plicaturopsis crispa FD-325 SS-3]|nr:hypothetical protein PLICRDRAFT_105153 [Plicaturopsis crispa FD-325 SS-3]
MEDYYRAQGLFGPTKESGEGGDAARETEAGNDGKTKAANDWEEMWEAMRTPLPITFRVAGVRETAQALSALIRDTYVPTLSDAVFEGERVPPPMQIPWYPDALAWQFNVPKRVLRKEPGFRAFHAFLVFETDVGNISRSEAVSMLPPLFLNVRPEHTVIDLCAAPGSKTAQLLESLHTPTPATKAGNDAPLPPGALIIPPGLLIANDSDHKRTHLLIHQSARLPSPAVCVTNCDASLYPSIYLDPIGHPGGRRQLLFDRILCDVPCSGDGTMRKNLGIWKSWGPGDGNGLHGLQLRILQRAMKMLKRTQDARIVYSTCSLNPVENEAVVAAALNANADFELRDVSTHLPALVRRPGLTRWRPSIPSASDKKAVDTSYASYAAYAEAFPDRARDGKVGAGHWPPENVVDLHLERCLRIYPHLQDTGGFFVAVIQRKRVAEPQAKRTDLKRGAETGADDIGIVKKMRIEEEDNAEGTEGPENAEAEGTSEGVADVTQPDSTVPQTEAPTDPTVSPTDTKQARRQQKGKDKPKESGGMFKENPYTFLAPDDPTLLTCMKGLNLTADFPAHNVLVRNPTGDAVRSLYLTNDLVKRVVQSNDYARLRLMTCGTKVFAKQDPGKTADAQVAQFRTLGEGLPVVLPYIRPETIVEADGPALRTLLQMYYPLCEGFAQPFRGVIEARESGSHVVRFRAGSFSGATLTHDLVLPLWKSNVSISLMIDKKAKSALSMRLFGEDVTIAGRDKDAAHQKKLASAKDAASVADVEADADSEAMVVEEPEQDDNNEQE